MDDLVHPGEHVPAELQFPQLPVLLEPGDALCLGLVGVKVSRKLQAMGEVEILGYWEHCLQGRETRSKQDIVIRIPKGTGVDTVNGASAAALLEEVEELKAVKTVGIISQNLSLANSITDGEARRDFGIPGDVAKFVNVDEDEEPQEDMTQLVGHLAEVG